jgi:hypothetical protein
MNLFIHCPPKTSLSVCDQNCQICLTPSLCLGLLCPCGRAAMQGRKVFQTTFARSQVFSRLRLENDRSQQTDVTGRMRSNLKTRLMLG